MTQPKPESWTEIAREAELEMRMVNESFVTTSDWHKRREAIIHRAIERSHAAQPQPSKASPLGERSEVDFRIGGCVYQKPSGNQPSGHCRTTDDKQEEWTHEERCIYHNEKHVETLVGVAATELEAHRITDAHNAALATAKDWSPIAAENVRLTQELAAERQRREQAEETIRKMDASEKDFETSYWRCLADLEETEGQLFTTNKQLLSAQAMNGILRQFIGRVIDFPFDADGARWASIKVAANDIISTPAANTALRKHDEEVREDQMQRDEAYWKDKLGTEVLKPLVDLLKRII